MCKERGSLPEISSTETASMEKREKAEEGRGLHKEPNRTKMERSEESSSPKYGKKSAKQVIRCSLWLKREVNAGLFCKIWKFILDERVSNFYKSPVFIQPQSKVCFICFKGLYSNPIQPHIAEYQTNNDASRSFSRRDLMCLQKAFPLSPFEYSFHFLWLCAHWQVWFSCVWVMPRADKPTCVNEILSSWQMTVFSTQALLGSALPKCLCCGNVLSAVMCTQNTRGSWALTLLCSRGSDRPSWSIRWKLVSTLAVFSQPKKHLQYVSHGWKISLSHLEKIIICRLFLRSLWTSLKLQNVS